MDRRIDRTYLCPKGHQVHVKTTLRDNEQLTEIRCEACARYYTLSTPVLMPACSCGAAATHTLHLTTRLPVRVGRLAQAVYCEPCADAAAGTPATPPRFIPVAWGSRAQLGLAGNRRRAE